MGICLDYDCCEFVVRLSTTFKVKNQFQPVNVRHRKQMIVNQLSFAKQKNISVLAPLADRNNNNLRGHECRHWALSKRVYPDSRTFSIRFPNFWKLLIGKSIHAGLAMAIRLGMNEPPLLNLNNLSQWNWHGCFFQLATFAKESRIGADSDTQGAPSAKCKLHLDNETTEEETNSDHYIESIRSKITIRLKTKWL